MLSRSSPVFVASIHVADVFIDQAFAFTPLFVAFIERAVAFIRCSDAFIGPAVMFIPHAVVFIHGAVAFTRRAVAFFSSKIAFTRRAVAFFSLKIALIRRADRFFRTKTALIRRAVAFFWTKIAFTWRAVMFFAGKVAFFSGKSRSSVRLLGKFCRLARFCPLAMKPFPFHLRQKVRSVGDVSPRFARHAPFSRRLVVLMSKARPRANAAVLFFGARAR